MYGNISVCCDPRLNYRACSLILSRLPFVFLCHGQLEDSDAIRLVQKEVIFRSRGLVYAALSSCFAGAVNGLPDWHLFTVRADFFMVILRKLDKCVTVKMWLLMKAFDLASILTAESEFPVTIPNLYS